MTTSPEGDVTVSTEEAAATEVVGDPAATDSADGDVQAQPENGIGADATSVATDEGDGAAADSGPTRHMYGFTGVIEGPVYLLEELEGTAEDKRQRITNRADLKALIEPTLTKVSKDEIISGRIIGIGEKDVVIDIGFKSDGVVSKNEFTEDIEVGSEVEVFLERIEDYHGQLVLSKTKADRVRRWEAVVRAFEEGTVLEGTVKKRIKGGMIVELLNGLDAFLPGSQIDVRPVRDFDAYLERRMEFKIVKINEANENIVVSHRALIEKELAAQRKLILDTMEAGQILEGTVKNITNFGVFVDLGGVDGLLHITDLSWGRVAHPSEVVDLDQELKVVVLDYQKERQRISLGYKQLQPHPWDDLAKRVKKDDVVEGKVVSITDYGAFVEIERGIEGLVHISEMSWTDHIRHPSQKVSLGQIVKVVVLNMDHESKKISLGMKQFETDPWEGIAERYAPGTVLTGTVRNITNFGVFVEVEPGIDGLVHISDLSWTKKVRHPGELVRKRQELSVVVLKVEENSHRISLGHKQIETNPWTHLATVYSEGTDHSAKILRVDSRGVVVELPLEVEAFVPGRELKQADRDIFGAYHEGDTLELRVIQMDANAREVIMSETAREREEMRQRRDSVERERRVERRREDQEVRQYTRRQRTSSGPATLGELSGLEALRKKLVAAERMERKATPKRRSKSRRR